MQISDDLFLGPAVAGGAGMAGASSGPSPQYQGVGPLGRVYLFDIRPEALAVNNVALAQQRVGAGNLVLTAGAGVTTQVVDGQTRYVLDVARSVSLTSAANLSGINFTITGWDIYGQRLSSQIAGPNNETVETPKAFKSVLSIASSATVGSNVSAGTGDTFGLPVMLTYPGYVLSVKWGDALADDAGTLEVGSDSVQTAGTGDVRGTYIPSSPSDGNNRLVMAIGLPSIAVGPNATRNGAFGLNQNLEPSSGGSL
jgi:hypothetical protein